MDLDEIDEETQAPARSSRIAPKSKLKKRPAKPTPKVDLPKHEPTPQSAEAPPVVVTVKKEKIDVAADKSTGAAVEVEAEAYGDGDMKKVWTTSDASSSRIGVDAMEEDVAEEDYVVAEYDVYFTPPDSDSQLYVMQHPLRPSWRPYELEQRCTEVRVKPISAEVEVDLSIEMESYNYDRDSSVADKILKETLSSSGRPAQAATYAVGLLKGKKLFLNPIHAVVQLRPSMEYLDFVDLKKKNANIVVKEEGSTLDAPGSSRKQKQTVPEVVESWIPLNYHSSTSDLARTYVRKMVTEEVNLLQFSMNPYDYLNSLCPGVATDKMKSSGLSRRSLLSLTLEERLEKLLIEGPHVQRFSAIKHLAPDVPAKDVLRIVQQHANLVQGIWVGKSRNRCTAGADMMARDYALFLFTQNPVVKSSEFEILGGNPRVKKLIQDIAVERPSCKDWKFKESTDVSFMKYYPDIVEHQRNKWQDHGKQILEKLTERRAGPKRPGPSVRSDQGLERATNEARSVSTSMSNEARSVSTSMSNETREALSKVLGKLFFTHKVCSFPAILRGLRDTAVSMSVLPKAGARNSAAMAAVKNVVDAPHEELQAVISEYAVNVHGVYVLKSSSEHPELNPLRNEVIDMFRGREPGATLKKNEIVEDAKHKSSEFQKVINEYCVSKGGAWVLKSGDGISSNDWQSIFKAAKLL